MQKTKNMEVKSKFNKGDIIYFMVNDQPNKRKITGITFFTGSSTKINGEQKITAGDFTQIHYHTEGCLEVAEQKAFATEEELKKDVFRVVFDGEYSPFDAPFKHELNSVKIGRM